MKRSILTLVLIALMATLAFGQTKVLEYQTIFWGNGTATSDSLVNSDKIDTTATFSFKQGAYFPDRVNFTAVSIEGAASDSSNTSYTLDLSNDGTYWYSWGVIETILSIATAGQSIVGDKIVSLEPAVTAADQLPAYKYGRIRATMLTAGADTLTCKLQMTKQFIQK